MDELLLLVGPQKIRGKNESNSSRKKGNFMLMMFPTDNNANTDESVK